MAYLDPDRFLTAMKKTPVLLNGILRGVSQERALASTDGPEGWSVVETVCHMVDFEEISLARFRVFLERDGADLPKFDHMALHDQRSYKTQALAAEFEKYLAFRRQALAVLSGLSEAQWQRRGVHANFGDMSLLEYALHIFWHDLNHIEQIVRSLGLSGYMV